MEQDTQRLQDSLNQSEASFNEATESKNSAIAKLEEFKSQNVDKELSAVEKATFNQLRDEATFARKLFNSAKANYEMAKYRARKAGIAVVERVKKAFILETDSPEIKAIKQEVVQLRDALSKTVANIKTEKKQHKEVVSAYKERIENLTTERGETKKAIATLMDKVYNLDPKQKPKETKPTGKVGRKSELDGKTISVHPDFATGENPHRAGSSVFDSFKAFRDSANQSINYNNAVATGIPARDIKSMVKSGKLVVND